MGHPSSFNRNCIWLGGGGREGRNPPSRKLLSSLSPSRWNTRQAWMISIKTESTKFREKKICLFAQYLIGLIKGQVVYVHPS